MDKVANFLLGAGITAMCIGFAGIDGSTPVGCTVVSLAGVGVFLGGCLFKVLAELKELELAKEEAQAEKAREELFNTWLTKCKLY